MKPQPNRERQYNAWVTSDCLSGKRAFATRADAKSHARKAKQFGAGHMRAYACPQCQYWHIGHTPEGIRNGTETTKW
jgi:rubredoxin